MKQENQRLDEIHNYIDNIKKYAYKDIYNLENLVLSKNPYTNDFVKNYLFYINRDNPSLFFTIKKFILFYIKNFIRFFIYLIGYIMFKIKFKKKNIDFGKNIVLIDTFFLVDKIISEQQFEERYFIGLYNILNKYKIKYVFLPRLYGLEKNPFKIVKLLNILNKEKYFFLFEYELLTPTDILKIVIFILKYPFKTIKLFQYGNKKIDKLFNYEIINSLSNTSFNAYTRYLVGSRIAEKISSNSRIISWQEFQNMEKTFNRAINESKKNIKIFGCQFFIQYENYISIHITDVDFELNITPQLTLLNGKYNYNLSKKQQFKNGVSLRYKNIFSYIGSQEEGEYILILLTYEIDESIRILELFNSINDDVRIKIHPTTNKNQFINHAKKEWKFEESDIYDLFRDSKLIIVGSMSGTGLEAVACGLTVIIIASKNSVTSNPLLEYGKGKIWDIAFCQDDIERLCNVLIEYKRNNKEEIQKIALWYKENFFIEPTEENIVKTFELDKEGVKE